MRGTRYRRSASGNQSLGFLKSSNYKSEQTGIRRHSVSASMIGTPSTLLPGEYFYQNLLKFRRAFGASDDSDPTATASNNFQTTEMMNGSKARNYTCKIKVANTNASDVCYLDVYAIALSYYDALVWDTIRTANCPVSFDTTTVGPPDLRGRVQNKAITATQILDNDIRNFKFQQHYIKKIGTLVLHPEDSGRNQQELIINRIPAKCRRSQTGMQWAIYFHNDSIKNNARTVNIESSFEVDFEEIPSNNRLPYIE